MGKIIKKSEKKTFFVNIFNMSNLTAELFYMYKVRVSLNKKNIKALN